MRQFVISDIHGCNKTFQEMLTQIGLGLNDELYLLGDFIDRGPDSKGVFDTIFDLLGRGFKVYCLRGNHEQMLLDGLAEPLELDMWLRNGGEETLESFGVARAAQIPSIYRKFMAGMGHYLEVNDHILVHAGLDFRRPDPLADKNSMLWIRDWYRNIYAEWLGSRTIVHGHTPMRQTDIVKMFEYVPRLQYLDIDGGCVFSSPDSVGGLGWLVAYEMTERKLYFQQNLMDY